MATIRVNQTKPKPVPPPVIESIDLRLSLNEAMQLIAVLGGFNHGPTVDGSFKSIYSLLSDAGIPAAYKKENPFEVINARDPQRAPSVALKTAVPTEEPPSL